MTSASTAAPDLDSPVAAQNITRCLIILFARLPASFEDTPCLVSVLYCELQAHQDGKAPHRGGPFGLEKVLFLNEAMFVLYENENCEAQDLRIKS